MRILFILPCAWDPRLGQARASIGLAEALAERGHKYDCFTVAQAGLSRGSIIASTFDRYRFQYKVRTYIRAEGNRYDVIQVEHDLLRFPRRDYRYDGILISKSVGLFQFYDQYTQTVERRLRATRGDWGTVPGRIIRGLERKLNAGPRVVPNGFDVADQIHLNNSDEFNWVKGQKRWASKAVQIRSGLSGAERNALAGSADLKRRTSSQTILFIGQWCYRKGRVEIPRIFRKVRQARPEARLRLLGTGVSSEAILPEFDAEDRTAVEIISSFSREECAELFVEARVGLFPSYIEGFPFACLELLAAGVPTIAWNVPGSREILNAGTLVAPGSIDDTARLLIEVLERDPKDYKSMAEHCLRRAEAFSWRDVANRYLEGLAPYGIAPATSVSLNTPLCRPKNG